MVPSVWVENNSVLTRKSRSLGVVLQLSKSGTLLENWRSPDIYPYEKALIPSDSETYDVLISNDGETVVKIKKYIGSVFKRKSSKKNVITIYKKGNVFKSYNFNEFYKSSKLNIPVGCTGVSWIEDKAEIKENLLIFKTRENRVIGVDITNGNKTVIHNAPNK